jgi:hypothetical protein
MHELSTPIQPSDAALPKETTFLHQEQYRELSRHFFHPYLILSERFYLITKLIRGMTDRDLTKVAANELEGFFSILQPNHMMKRDTSMKRNVDAEFVDLDEIEQKIFSQFFHKSVDRVGREYMLIQLFKDMVGTDITPKGAKDFEEWISLVMLRPAPIQHPRLDSNNDKYMTDFLIDTEEPGPSLKDKYATISEHFFNPFFLKHERWDLLSTMVKSMTNIDLTQRAVHELQDTIELVMIRPTYEAEPIDLEKRGKPSKEYRTVGEAYEQIEKVFWSPTTDPLDRHIILVELAGKMIGLDYTKDDGSELEETIDMIMSR